MSLVTVTQVKCSACGRQYQQQVHQAIDSGKEPQLKSLLLTGRFNVTSCPQCGNQGLLNRPFLYHDPEKLLFLILQPMDLRAGTSANQQVIGSLSSQFMSGLKPEERRGYMLQPKVYLTLQSMVDDIMVADGITREEIQAARERTALLEELAQAATLEDLKQKVEQNKDKIDYAFFEVLTSYMEQAAESGDTETAQALGDLRDDLLGLTQVEGVEPQGKPLEVDREALMQALIEERDPERLHQLVAVARPALDYFFFQMLAERIDAVGAEGNEIEKRRLSRVRDTILQTMDDLDQQSRELLTQAAAFLRDTVSQPAPEAYLRQNAEHMDDAFFAVLNANIGEAQRRQDEATAKALAALGTIAVRILQESAPPEVRLINEVIQSKPEERRAKLEEHRELLSDQLLSLIDQMSGTLRGGNPTVARELAQVRSLIEEIRGES
ncbi:MAG: CpXC domain-containing protein [Anaerolineae bacterium]